MVLSKVSAIDVTAKTTYERLVLVLGWRSVANCASMPSASSSPLPPLTLQRLLDFPVFSFKLFPRTAPEKCKLLENVAIWPTSSFLLIISQKSPFISQKSPIVSQKSSKSQDQIVAFATRYWTDQHWKEPYLLPKEPYIPSMEPSTLKRPQLLSKEP